MESGPRSKSRDVPRARYSALTRQLLDAGVAPKYVTRLREELEDHLADLAAELEADRCRGAARREAARRIGAPDAILAEFTRRPELRAWVYRSRSLMVVLQVVGVLVLTGQCLWGSLRTRRAGITRLAVSVGAAAVVTCSLLLAMSLATLSGWSRPLERETHEITARTAPASTPLPIPAMPPPIHISLPDPLREAAPELAAVAWSTEVSVESRPGPLVFPRPSEGDYHPIVRSAPTYPAMAASLGIEGYVVVEFTVTRTGSVKDVVVVESSDELFVEAAVRATYKFKYKPRMIDGEPIEVLGVRNRISFRLRA